MENVELTMIQCLHLNAIASTHITTNAASIILLLLLLLLALLLPVLLLLLLNLKILRGNSGQTVPKNIDKHYALTCSQRGVSAMLQERLMVLSLN